ncbi:hypothetical protein HZA97_04995 [Candidatus Woesearchaeota archaeon]|nr:hypothetical protein [Candidatus Woesearchaeota archaeon]
MAEKPLDKALDERVKPLLAEAMHKFLGVSVDEIKSDISDKIKKSPLIDYLVDTNVPFKKAKKNFKKYYISKMLMLHFGNISEVAKILGLTREALHRAVKELKIDPNEYRRELFRKEYIKEIKIKDILEKTFETYKSSLNPEKLEQMYQNLPVLSKNIVKELPDDELTLKEAERKFERRFLKKALEESNNNMSKAAKRMGLRFETLHRKLKKLGLK